VNTYKLFLEQTHALLGKGGAFGMLVPLGIYSDLGTKGLRKLFLERCRWDFWYAFQNERFVFANVDHRFKVAVIGMTKGERTEEIAARFRLGPGGSPEVEELRVPIGQRICSAIRSRRTCLAIRSSNEGRGSGSGNWVWHAFVVGLPNRSCFNKVFPSSARCAIVCPRTSVVSPRSLPRRYDG
jgi:hypothetical protein